MFFRVKSAGSSQYLQIVHSVRQGEKVRQQVFGTLGRLDELKASGRLEALIRSGLRHCEKFALIDAHAAGETQAVTVQRIGADLVFGRLWKECGIGEVIQSLLKARRYDFDVERAIYLTVLHRLFASGSDRAAERWREDYLILGTEALDLHHLYRAMAFLGQEIEPKGQKTLGSPRCLKDLIEEELFERRRDLFTEVDLVFFDTTSLYFEGRGGESIGKRGHNKDHRPDLYQMVVGMALDVEGRPICCEMWPGNTADVKTLIPIVKRMRERFRLREITVVADRGMVSRATLEAFEKSDPPVRYIVGVRMRRQKEVNASVLGSRARWFESVPERSNAKDPAPLKVKEVWVKDRRYIVCLNEEERRKDAHDREAIVAHLKDQLRERSTKAWSVTKAIVVISKWKEAATSLSMKNKSKPKSATTASGCYGLTPSTILKRWLTSTRRCGRLRTFSVRANRSLRPVPSTTSAMRLFEVMSFAVSWP